MPRMQMGMRLHLAFVFLVGASGERPSHPSTGLTNDDGIHISSESFEFRETETDKLSIDIGTGAEVQSDAVALFVIEGQEQYRRDYGPAVIGNMKRIVNAFEERGLPVFRRVWYCKTESGPGRNTPCGDTVFEDGPHGPKLRLLKELTPRHDRMEQAEARTWISFSYSMFGGVRLDEYLRHAQVNTIVLIGGFVEECIAATAFDARNRGYNVVLAEDGVGPMVWFHKVAKATFRALSGVARIIPSASIISGLKAGTHGDQVDVARVAAIATGVFPYKMFLSNGEAPEMEDFGKNHAERWVLRWRLNDPVNGKGVPRNFALLVVKEQTTDSRWRDSFSPEQRSNLEALQCAFKAGNQPTLTWEENCSSASARRGPIMKNVMAGLAKDTNTLVVAGGPLLCGALLIAAAVSYESLGVDVFVATDAVATGGDLAEFTDDVLFSLHHSSTQLGPTSEVLAALPSSCSDPLLMPAGLLQSTAIAYVDGLAYRGQSSVSVRAEDEA